MPGTVLFFCKLWFINCADILGSALLFAVLFGVEIPGSAATIGEGIFENSVSLTEVVFPGSITSISDSMF